VVSEQSFGGVQERVVAEEVDWFCPWSHRSKHRCLPPGSAEPRLGKTYGCCWQEGSALWGSG